MNLLNRQSGSPLINPFLYIRTIKHLKRQQIQNRIIRKFKSQLHISAQYQLSEAVGYVQLQAFPPAKKSLYLPHTFHFLNKQKTYPTNINWNDLEYGKLWTYHLNYFEYLIQSDIDKSTGVNLIHQYIHCYSTIKDGKEPYPISLRLIHVIKFMAKYQVTDLDIDIWIGEQALLLKQTLEFHLLGNHLLENGFALFFAAYHLRDSEILAWATKLVIKELEEQILSDGAHFELSPLYHCTMFSRLLDVYNLVTSNKIFNSNLDNYFADKAALMLNWLSKITLNGNVPEVNDTFDISQTDVTKLMQYSYSLNIPVVDIPLGDSGYRFLKNQTYTCLFDVGKIGPDYIPGHAHADTLQILLWINNEPILVETGVSTYEDNPRREFERSTAAHNTVEVNQLDSSEVWSSFRVGDRATIIALEEHGQTIKAAHDGYRHLDVVHERTVSALEQELIIEDNVTTEKPYPIIAYLHFHPDQKPKLNKATIQLKTCTIRIEQSSKIELVPCELAGGYNKTIQSIKAAIHFEKQLLTRIQIG